MKGKPIDDLIKPLINDIQVHERKEDCKQLYNMLEQVTPQNTIEIQI